MKNFMLLKSSRIVLFVVNAATACQEWNAACCLFNLTRDCR